MMRVRGFSQRVVRASHLEKIEPLASERWSVSPLLGMEIKMSELSNFDINTANYVITDYIRGITTRAIMYVNNGYPLHLRGPAGVGKTSLAIHIAKKLERPVLLICGSEDVNSENLIGSYSGMRKYFVEDNFITTVYKKEEMIKKTWNDGKLLNACKEGYTVIYDEFTRTPAQINNVFLPILEEKIIDVPYGEGNTFVKIHPEFRIIFTSNPEEYVGVYHSPNALTDRMITIDINNMDEETERNIIMSKSGLNIEESFKIMKLSRYIKNKLKEMDYVSIRGGIMLAKVVRSSRIKMVPSNVVFRQITKDIFNSVNISMQLSEEKRKELERAVDEGIDLIFANK